MSFFKEPGRDFLSGWLEESFHSFQPARGDKELNMQTIRKGSAAGGKQGPHIVLWLSWRLSQISFGVLLFVTGWVLICLI